MNVDSMFHLDVHRVLQSAGVVALGKLAQTKPQSREVDLAQSAEIQSVEQALFKGLGNLTPQAYLLSETGRTQGRLNTLRWHLSPIDGAMNYLRGRAGFAMSACLFDGADLLGAWIFDPLRQKVACVGNQLPIQVNGFSPRLSSLLSMKGAMLCVGSPLNSNPDVVQYYWQRVALAERWGMQVQRSGCASLDLLGLLEGAVDAVYNESASYVSIQAGWHLAKAAGLVLSALPEECPLIQPTGIYAVQPQIVDEIMARWPTNPDLLPV